MTAGQDHFQWKERFALGDERLDTEHRYFFHLINELYLAIEAQRGEQVLAALYAALRGYTEIHFRDEEAYLAKVGYPELQQQILEHGRFLQHLKEMPMAAPGAQAALAFMRDWLIEHILGSDQEFVRWHQGRGSRANP